jgi:hypothetical protein
MDRPADPIQVGVNYGNMPAMGLGAVAGVVPVGRRGDSFKERMNVSSRAA